MGQNLARNFASRKIPIVVFNRTTKTAEDFIAEHGNDFLSMQAELANFVASLERPRKIILMVQAGRPVDAVIDGLLPLLEEGDIIIDGGNTHYPDTIRREKDLKARGIGFVGCGISGGEEGALNGPSIMPGGDDDMLDALMPLFEPIAAKDFHGGACVTKVGANGAGHYVKMVHNGIEYAVMQFLAEAYDMMRGAGKSAPEIASVFGEWNKGRLASFLVELSETILQKRDPHGEGYLIDKVLDSAGQKGTGRWTVLDATERAVAVPTISAAVNARIFSGQKKLRVDLQQAVSPERNEKEVDIKALEKAIYIAMISAYSEGFWLIAKAAKEMEWEIDYSEVSRIWQGGCIIRAELLTFLEKNFRENDNDRPLLSLPEIVTEIKECLPALRATVTDAVATGVPIPGLLAALAHLEQMTRAGASANFIQGLRDAFGAHTFERTDREGSFHEEWMQS